jgi:preprotein translocase subunit YajC
MRNGVTILAVVLCLSLAGWSQETPSSAEPQNPPPGEAGRPGPGRWRGMGVAGSITALTDNSISIKTRDGQTVQVNLSDQTQFRKDREPAKIGDFKVGDMVFVRGKKGDNGVWDAQVVGSFSGRGPGRGPGARRMREGLGTQFIAGEIKSISGTQLTIERPDGVTQTINVDENTSFRKQQESITLVDLKPGDHVFGRGEMKNGTFVPTVLNVGQPGFRRWNGNPPPQQ